MLPINNHETGQFSADNDEMAPKIVVKRSTINGAELLKVFTESSRQYHCRINFNIVNPFYINQSFLIVDDISKLSVTNINPNVNVYRNDSILMVRFNYTGVQNFVLNYDFVPNNIIGTEVRNVSASNNQSVSPEVDSYCLQRGNFNDSVGSNPTLILCLIIALILVVVIFIILFCIFCRPIYFVESDADFVKPRKKENMYSMEMKLLTEDSNKTYYESQSNFKSEIQYVTTKDHTIFESDLLNARRTDKQLQDDLGKLDDVVFIIWLNSVAEKYPNMRDKCTQISKQRQADKEKIIKDYQIMVEERFKIIKKDIIRKNNVNLDHLKVTQDQERERIMEKVTKNDKEEVEANLNKLFEKEREDIAYQLKVEQESAFEDVKLKCHTEMMQSLNANQIAHAKNVINTAQLSPEESAEIMQNYLQSQQKLQGVSENEKIRQSAAMALLLEDRINQAKMREAESKCNSELLDTKIDGFVKIITDYEENEDISRDLSSKILSQFEEDKLKLLSDMEKQKRDQTNALLERLNADKRKKLEDLKTKQDNEINNLQIVHATDKEPTNLINEIERLRTVHRQEVNSVETETDDKITMELVSLLEDIGVQTLRKIDESIAAVSSELKYSGFSEADIEDIIRDSNIRIAKIKKIQELEKNEQAKALEMRLLKIRQDIEDNAAHQSKVQSNIIIAQYDVMNDVTNMQKTLSEAERNNIIELFEKNKASMETNLANQCIQQRRMMEAALNAKKDEKMRKLEETLEDNINEITGRNGKKGGQQNNEIAISKCVADFVADKLMVAQQENSQTELDKEMEKIRKEILEERVILIHRKEEEIAALLNKFQIAKAAQHIELKEQQEKLKELQVVVLDTIDIDKSVNNIINKYDQNKETLTVAIDMNKRRQEDDLQKRLLRRKKINLLAEDGDRIDEPDSQIISQVKKQNIENDILQNTLQSEKDIKQLETDFLKQIIESANFSRSELLTILREKFPLKSNQEIDVMAEEIYPKAKDKTTPTKSLIDSQKKITESNKSQSRPGSSMSEMSMLPRNPPMKALKVEEPLLEVERPTTSKRLESKPPRISQQDYDFPMDNRRDDLSPVDEPEIIKPKRKRKKRRNREEPNDEEEIL